MRAILTNGFRVRRLALGERNSYLRCLRWVTADWDDADWKINFQNPFEFPRRSGSIDLIYSAHMLEHLKDASVSHLLRECRRILSPNGIIRLTCPNAEAIIQAYRNEESSFLDDMVIEETKYFSRHKPDQPEFGTKHVTFLGMLSNHIQDSKHTPVVADRKTIDVNVGALSVDEFCQWAVSLQTTSQTMTGGHVNGWYPEKLCKFLEEAGFTRIALKQAKSSEVWNFEKLEYSDSRNNYSFFVEACP